MTLLDKLERRIGFIAIPALVKVLVGFTALVYVLTFLNQELLTLFYLDPAAVRRGEVWRLFTFIFLPSAPARPGAVVSPLFVVLALMFLWRIGEGLESAWGAFRLTLYFLLGMVATIAAAFIFNVPSTNAILAASLFFAFAWFYPDEVIYVLFILPMKIKWVALLTAVLLVLSFLNSTMSARMAMLLGLANYFIFFGPEVFRQMRHRKDVSERRQRFELQTRNDAEPLHKCAVCGQTEITSPDLEFRVSRDGEEYCVPHLPSATPAATHSA